LEEANGEPMASQTKLNAGSESGLAWGRRGFLREYKGDAIERIELSWRLILSRIILASAPERADTPLYTRDRNGKAFAAGRQTPSRRLLAFFFQECGCGVKKD
jgi:hypothetical protein